MSAHFVAGFLEILNYTLIQYDGCRVSNFQKSGTEIVLTFSCVLRRKKKDFRRLNASEIKRDTAFRGWGCCGASSRKHMADFCLLDRGLGIGLFESPPDQARLTGVTLNKSGEKGHGRKWEKRRT